MGFFLLRGNTMRAIWILICRLWPFRAPGKQSPVRRSQQVPEFLDPEPDECWFV
jgi:hypothetical protein